MFPKRLRPVYRAVTALLLLLPLTHAARAGGPRWVAGTSYFDPSVEGKSVRWPTGKIVYYTETGALTKLITNAQADALVAAAAASWTSVPTAAVSVTLGGKLAEDVNSTNVTAGPDGAITMPADMQATATTRPVAVVYDRDGKVTDTFYGVGASQNCQQFGVSTYVDNVTAFGAIQHAVMIVNGLCATTTSQDAVLQYQIERGFGRILGLDWSQANEGMFALNQTTADGLYGWPLMHPLERLCNVTTSPCLTDQYRLRYDDLAALNRLYPVTAANLGNFSGKQLTAASTVTVQGTLHFTGGQGMQGVNVVVQPINPATGQPDQRYTVTAVTGAFFTGSAGNRVNGVTAPAGQYGTSDMTMEGYFDVSGIPLPPGTTTADYQVSFEPINSLYTGLLSVGPYAAGQVVPSGTMPTVMLPGLTAGAAVLRDITVPDSEGETATNDGSEQTPALLTGGGEWNGRLTGYGHSAWFLTRLRANREFTVEAMALDGLEQPTEAKLRPVLGIWNGTDLVGAAAVVRTLQPFNAQAIGVTSVTAVTLATDFVRLGLADDRGDGRPDYAYHGRLLYADSVTPARLPSSGGTITITGMGFRQDAVVRVNGLAANVLSVTPTQIVAAAPPSNGFIGTVLLLVQDPNTYGVTAIQDGLSYDVAGGDQIGILSAPAGTQSIGVPVPYTVRVIASDGRTPVAGATVTFNTFLGVAGLPCGQTSCTATSGGDGVASVLVTPQTATQTGITASIGNGQSVTAEFTSAAPPDIAPVTPALYLAAGSTSTWLPMALTLQGGAPAQGIILEWSTPSTAVQVPTTASVTSATGQGWTQVMAGPMPAGSSAPVYACISGTSSCATFTIYSVHTETALLGAVSGAGQSLTLGQQPAPVVLRVMDAIGDPMAGALVSFSETLRQWTPPCPSAQSCPGAGTAGPVLASLTQQAISGPDGTVVLNPMTGTGQATRLLVTATTGGSAVLNFEIDTTP